MYVAILSMMTMTQLSLWRVHWKMETLSTSPSLLTEDILPSLKSGMQLEPGIYLALTSVRYVQYVNVQKYNEEKCRNGSTPIYRNKTGDDGCTVSTSP